MQTYIADYRMARIGPLAPCYECRKQIMPAERRVVAVYGSGEPIDERYHIRCARRQQLTVSA